MDFVQTELARMGVCAELIERIREKDGVIVARVHSGGKSCVFKGFVNPDFRREIENYRTLNALDVPTLRVISATDASLLMEDVEASSVWRLGVEADMDDLDAASALAAWYRRLHAAGYAYVARHGGGLYDENDVITPENLDAIKKKTGTGALRVWTLIERNLDTLLARIHGARRTLTYNDFYYTNLIVARSGGAAMMFDYNLLGKGYAYADVRNVCASLSARAGEAFCKAYGAIDTHEKHIDDVASVLTTLHFACARETFPGWAQGELARLRGDFARKVERLLAD